MMVVAIVEARQVVIHFSRAHRPMPRQPNVQAAARHHREGIRRPRHSGLQWNQRPIRPRASQQYLSKGREDPAHMPLVLRSGEIRSEREAFVRIQHTSRMDAAHFAHHRRE
jgi:hypothetical protein